MQIPVTGVNATDYIKPRNDPAAYAPSRLIDGNESTSFQIKKTAVDQGNAFLYFDFGESVMPDEMWIKNGFWKTTDGYDQYYRNCRVRRLTVDFRYTDTWSYQDAQTVTLDDLGRADWIAVPLNVRATVTGIRIRIDDVYIGERYPTDVCISEIMFVQSVYGD